MDTELLTDDEKLLRKPKWQGEVRDLPTAIRALARVHHLADDDTIEDSENWNEFVDELVTVIQQLNGSVTEEG